MLELGCGNGRVTSALGEVAHSVIGVESHPGMRALALNETDGLANVTIMDGDMSDMGDWGLFHGLSCPSRVFLLGPNRLGQLPQRHS